MIPTPADPRELGLETTELRRLCEKATPGPWAFEGTSEKSNDYMVGVVCPVDDRGNPGPQISGHVQEHPHYFNVETDKFGEWYCEGVAQIYEGYHGADASCFDDAAFIAASREWIPKLLAEVDRLTAALSEEREACAKIAYIPPDQPDHDGRTRLPSKRDEFGHLVRRAWIAWAKTQPNPKPSWLVPYSGLSPEDREADCQIGEAVANHIAAAIRGRSNA